MSDPQAVSTFIVDDQPKASLLCCDGDPQDRLPNGLQQLASHNRYNVQVEANRHMCLWKSSNLSFRDGGGQEIFTANEDHPNDNLNIVGEHSIVDASGQEQIYSLLERIGPQLQGEIQFPKGNPVAIVKARRESIFDFDVLDEVNEIFFSLRSPSFACECTRDIKITSDLEEQLGEIYVHMNYFRNPAINISVEKPLDVKKKALLLGLMPILADRLRLGNYYL